MPSATAGSQAYRTDKTPPISSSRRYKELSCYVEPQGIEQQEKPNQQHYARDKSNHPRVYPREECLDHDPLMVDAQVKE
jgi:hypothetical protein